MRDALERVRPGPLDAFSHASYVLVRPLFSWSRLYRVHAPDGRLVAFVEQPWFRLRTELVMYGDERPAGLMLEDGHWFWRRMVRFLPGRHHIELGGREVARIAQRFHLFRREFQLEILPVDDPIEPRFAIACALIAMMADLRRENR